MRLMPVEAFADACGVAGFCGLNGTDYATHVFQCLICARKRYSCLMDMLEALDLEYLTDVDMSELVRRAQRVYADEPLALQVLESSDPLQCLGAAGVDFVCYEEE